MPKPERFLYICTNSRPEGHPRGACSQKGGGAILMRFAELLNAEGLKGKITLATSGCVGPCSSGPLVSVMPDNVWYKSLTTEDVDEIVIEHLKGNRPVTRLEMEDRDWG